ncbi:class I SAM-dependent methyltransferase [Leifsonia lichenia]
MSGDSGRTSGVPRITQAELTSLQATLVASLTGRVLEIGAGRGANFDALSPEVDWTGLEPVGRFRTTLAERAAGHGRHRPPADACAERLPVDDGSVDAVLATFALCSVSDLGAALSEARRVLRTGGRLVFVEHVASLSGPVRGMQSLASPISAALDHGCHWNRDPVAAAAKGFVADEVRRVHVSTGVLGLAVSCVLYDGHRT